MMDGERAAGAHKSFHLSLASTLREIEAAQPQPGFTALFMNLLDKRLEGAILSDAAEGLDTREGIEILRKLLGDMIVAHDIGDAQGKAGYGKD